MLIKLSEWAQIVASTILLRRDIVSECSTDQRYCNFHYDESIEKTDMVRNTSDLKKRQMSYLAIFQDTDRCVQQEYEL